MFSLALSSFPHHRNVIVGMEDVVDSVASLSIIGSVSCKIFYTDGQTKGRDPDLHARQACWLARAGRSSHGA
jgi:hypothetical protein